VEQLRPGRDTVNAERLIINAPDLQSLRQRYGGQFLTLLLWGAWIYLLMPLASLLLWLLGVQIAYEHMISLGGLDGLLDQLQAYSLAVIVIGVSWIGWSQYNRIRYGKRPRRRTSRPTHVAALAAFYGVSPANILEARRARTLWVEVGEVKREIPQRLTMNPEVKRLQVVAAEEQGFRGRRGARDPFLAHKDRRRPRRRR